MRAAVVISSQGQRSRLSVTNVITVAGIHTALTSVCDQFQFLSGQTDAQSHRYTDGRKSKPVLLSVAVVHVITSTVCIHSFIVLCCVV